MCFDGLRQEAIPPEMAAEILGLHSTRTIKRLRHTGVLEVVWVDGRTPWVTRRSVELYRATRRKRGRPRKALLD
jgi:hypothetical protein